MGPAFYPVPAPSPWKMTDRLVIIYHVPRVAAKDREAFIEARRDAILEAALRLFGEGGFDGTSVEAIAREAGLSKGALYLYFESKLAILEELFRRRSLIADIERLAPVFRDRPLAEAIPLLVRTAWRRLRESEDLVRCLLREMPTHPEIARSFLERLLLPANRLFADFLAARLDPAQRAGLHMLAAGRSLLGMVMALFITQEVLGGRELVAISEDEIVATVSRIFLHGVQGGAP